MPRSLSLTSAQINALTTGDNTILFNAQSRDILLYGGANLEGKIGALEIDNLAGDCLTLKYNASSTNFVNFALTNTGTLNVNINGGNKIFNIVNHNGTSTGLSLGGTLLTSTANQLNAMNTTPGTAEANKAIVLDGNLDIVGIHNLETDNLTVNGTLVTASATELNYTDITTAGTVQASKAVIVDVDKDISGFRNLTSTGNVNISNHDGSTTGLELNGTLVTSLASDINKLSTVTEGTVTASKVLIVDSNKDLSSLRHLTTAGNLNLTNHDGSTTGLKLAGTLVTSSASQLNTVNVTPGTATANKAVVLDANLDITGIHNLETDNLTVNGTLVTASATELNYTDITTAGTVQASKAVIVDVDKDISGFRNLTTDGNINIYNYNGTTVGLKLAGDLVTSSAAEINTLDGVTAGTVTASKALVVDSNKDLTAIRNLDVDGGLNVTGHDGLTIGLELAGTLVTASAAEINTLDGVTAGTVTESKALVVDANKDLSSIRNLELTGTLSGVTTLTATTLEGTLSTAAQPNITSVGSLTGLTTAGLTLGSTAITATGTEINKLAGVTPGTASTNKTLVLNSSGDISGINSISTTSLIVNGVTITSSGGGSIGPDYTTGVTPGTANANSSLVLDTDKNITGINSLSSTTLAGTLSTAAQTNITSVGTLTSLTLSGALSGATTIGCNSNLTVTRTTNGQSFNSTNGTTQCVLYHFNNGIPYFGTTGTTDLILQTNGTGRFVINGSTGNITGISALTATSLTGTLQTVAQPNITSTGNLTLPGSLTITNGGTPLNFTNTSSSSNFRLSIDGTSGNIDIRNNNGTNSTLLSLYANGKRQLTCINNNDYVNLPNHNGSSAGLQLAGTLVTSTAAEINTLSGVTAGTALASKALILDSSRNVNNIDSISLNGNNDVITITNASTSARTSIRFINDIQSWELGSRGSANAPNSSFYLFNNIDSNYAFSVNTSSQVDISQGLMLAGTLITSSASEINTLAGVTAGTVTANKALVVNNNKDLSSLRNLTLTGTLSGVTTLGLSGVITSTNATATSSNTTGALVLSGGIGISNATDAISSTNGGTFTSAGGGAFAKSLYVGTNLTVGGNLTISGTTTSVNSTNVLINDNVLSLNSGPSGTGFDSGFLTQRYQIDNTGGTGDVVNDTLKETYALSAATSTTITLPGGANATNDYYKFWWIKIASGAANNHVRQISSYNGTTKVATLATAFSTTPASTNTVNLYNKQYSAFVWQEANNRFVTAYTAIDPTAGSTNIIDYADFATSNQNILSTTTSTSNGTGALRIAGGIGISNTTDATSSTNGGTFTSAGGGAFAKSLYVGGSIIAPTMAVNGIDLGSNIAFISGVSAGTVTASKALIVDSNKDLASLRNLTLTGTFTLGGSAFTAASLGSVLGVTPGTAFASKALIVDSNLDIGGIRNLSATGVLTVGTAGSSDNRINFKGVTGDSPDTYTVLAERLYGASDVSELLLFKGNDGAGASGPDRIRLRAPEIRFQVAGEIYSSLGDNNDIMVVQNDTSVAINTLLSIGANRNYASSSFGANINVNDCTLLNSYTASSGTDAGHFKKISIGVTTLSTVSNTAVTTTNASSLFIQSAPVAGTRMSISNAYALYVNSGQSYFGGAVTSTGDISTPARLKTTASGYGWQHQQSGGAEIVSWTSTTSGQIGTVGNFEFGFLQNNDVKMCIDTSGNVGIGTRTPSSKLDVNGSLECTSLTVNGFAVTAVPVGTIVMWATTSLPSGWIKCDGDWWGTGTYPALFAVLGTAYGTNGANTFRVPNLGGRFPLGYGGSYTSMGATGGSSTTSISTENLPSNLPTVGYTASFNSNKEAISANASNRNNGDATSLGSGTPLNTMPPYIVLYYIIKAV